MIFLLITLDLGLAEIGLEVEGIGSRNSLAGIEAGEHFGQARILPAGIPCAPRSRLACGRTQPYRP
jgi:hypothetical protein